MKGDFTSFSHDPNKHYTRVLKQQGRVDLDADWNESIEIFTHLERTEAQDVIGRCGAPELGSGYKICCSEDGSNLTISRGRIYVDGILCSNEGDPDAPGADEPLLITRQEMLPGYPLPDTDGVYLAYTDVWERHMTYIEDPDIREVALGGPDTTTRTRTVCQVKLESLGADGPLEDFACRQFTGITSTGHLAAQAEMTGTPSDPCVVPAGAGYRGLENRLYRVEIHDNGRDAGGSPVRTPTFKWSRDNGAVVLPIADGAIDGGNVTLKRFGPDGVLTVKIGDWVEVSGDETELYGRHGTLGQIVPDGIDKANLQITLSKDASIHQGEGHLKLRRWDHHATDKVALQDGALPVQGDWFELEDGVQICFDEGATYHIGDYWVIPARTREGAVLWPKEGGIPARRRRMGIHHHYCSLALVRRVDGVWTEVRECRKLFPPLTEIGYGACCIRVMPGEDIQQAVDTTIGAGGGCIQLCRGVHEIQGALRITGGRDIQLAGVGTATVLRLAADAGRDGGIVIENGRRISLENMFLAGGDVDSLIVVRHDDSWEINRDIVLSGLTLCNTASDGRTGLRSAIRLAQTEGVLVKNCRMAADAGAVVLWGNRLPDITGRTETLEENGAVLAFEDLRLNTTYHVGDRFSEGGISVKGEPFVWLGGETTAKGFARVEDSGRAGGAGQDLQTNNINLSFQLPAAFRTASLRFGFYGGNVNLRVNGELLNMNSISALHGQTAGGVNITVAFAPDSQQLGTLILKNDTRLIRTVSVGGQELWIDDVVFQEPAAAWDHTYGVAVSDLFMEDATIRYGSFGILSAACERWRLERSDIRRMTPKVWDEAAKRLADAASLQDYADLLDRLEMQWMNPDSSPGASVAISAFLWRDSTVCKCELGGCQGIDAFWWIRGHVRETRIDSEDAGFYAFWLHDASITSCRITAAKGTAVSFAGSYRSRLDNNRMVGLIGIADLCLAVGLDHLSLLQSALAQGYGGQSDQDRFILFWIMTDVSADLMELRSLMAAIEAQFAGIVGGVPVTVFAAFLLATALGGQTGETDGSPALPLIDLHMSANEISCEKRGIFLKNFIPLGSLRVTGNRILATSGQAVLIEACRFLANGHLSVFLYRSLFDRMLEKAERNEGEQSGLAKAWYDLLDRWRQDSERFLELDFHIQGNTIRSLRTAVESNIFEMAIAGNHITMVERIASVKAANATIFGKVTDAAGNGISGATVRVAGTARAVSADKDGSYLIAGIPPGIHVLQASQTGRKAVSQEIDAGSDEQVELNFNLTKVQFWGLTRLETDPINDRVSNALLAHPFHLTAGDNTEIEKIAAALETTEAFEPLAGGLREGTYTEPVHYNAYLLGDNGPLSDAGQRNAAAGAVTAVGGLTSDPELKYTCDRLNTAMHRNDRTALQIMIPRFIRLLQGYTDSQGLLIKGIGCRIVDNQVIVPADAKPDTQGRGGIQVSVDLADLLVTVLTATFLQQQVLGSNEDAVCFDPLLGVTETLIDNNEVIGGIGHGISIQGASGRPDYLQDLRVRGNQIRGLAGCGIYCSENAFIVGLNIEGNHISDCGRTAGFSRTKGGIVLHNAAICRIHGNSIVRSGAGVSKDAVLGVDLDTIYGLHFHGNRILSNGSEQASLDDGGLRMQEVYGATILHGNIFSENRGIGLIWENIAQSREDALFPEILIEAMNLYCQINTAAAQVVREDQASLQNNVFKTGDDSALLVFKLLNLNQIIFSGNTCRADTTYGSMGEIENTRYGIVSHNMIDTNSKAAIDIRNMTSGIITGNNGSALISVSASGHIEHGLNIPAVIIS